MVRLSLSLEAAAVLDFGPRISCRMGGFRHSSLGFGVLGMPFMLMAALTFHSSAATLVVTTTSDSGSGSLRQAILDANATNGLDSIVFQIPGTAPFTITPLAALPAITDPVVIDGTTQPGYTPNHPIIELSGVSA